MSSSFFDLHQALGDIVIARVPNHSRGKVRDSYDLPDGRRTIAAMRLWGTGSSEYREGPLADTF